MKTFFFPLIALIFASSCAHADNASAPDPNAIIQAKLDSVVIPIVNFQKVPLEKVAETLEKLYSENAPSPDDPRLHIVITDESLKNIPVSIILRKLPLSKILEFVCASIGTQWEIKGEVVLISAGQASSSDGSLKTESFPLNRATVIGVSSEASRSWSGSSSDPFAPAAGGSPSLSSGYIASNDPSVSLPTGQNAGPEYNREGYDRIVDNPFLSPLSSPLSTFSIDVDTASYANVRRFIEAGKLPPPDAVRIEELINYFPYDYAPPATVPMESETQESISNYAESPFAVHVEVGPAPWHEGHSLVRIGLKGIEVDWNDRPPVNLVFLLDVSGSMNAPNKLPLVKKALRLLVSRLDARDRVAVVVYAGASGLALPSSTANNQETIQHAINNLQAGGSTNAGEGIELAYQTATDHFIEGGVNRVILCTDGDFNVGVTDRGQLTRLVEDNAKSGVALSILGFGMGNYRDDMLETLSNKSDGSYTYIDTESEARKVFMREAAGSLITIAKDVKMQVEFNPNRVKAYRLIGYENRVLRDEEFNDDTVDAGDLGAGHTVTALYEIAPPSSDIELPGVDPLKYQSREAGSETDELLTLKLRYKWPQEEESLLLTIPVAMREVAFEDCSEDFRFAVAVAGWGNLLRDSPYKGDVSADWVVQTAQAATGEDPGGYRDAFVTLAEKSKALLADEDPDQP
ncbi:MAG: von Willebrand factor type A domain-containing protein [Verrucomicrobiota bacterium JB024]|nr:von Willebrand factor type A domain-containing protein [Verrucomicrobiota bacterium JB024]